MEPSIIKDFKKLRLIAACNIEGMDELVNDLAKALEESSTIHRASSADDIFRGSSRPTPRWKKRGFKHRNKNSAIVTNITEPSDSSFDDTNIELTDSRMQQSDSDETNNHTLTRLRIPVGIGDRKLFQSIESDSVNEGYAPMRPQRRRRKFKTMAIDPSPDNNDMLDVDDMSKDTHKKKRLKQMNPYSTEFYIRNSMVDGDHGHSSSFCESMIPGKRKRNSRSRSENYRVLDRRPGNVDRMDTIDHHDSSSITTSSSDSDFRGVMTNDEAREADDEQSDFFHETGPACGIIPLWNRIGSTTPTMDSDSTFEQLLRRSSTTRSTPQKATQQCQINDIFDNPSREIRAGRRKLKERKPRYTVTRFIQDRQNWKAMQTKYASCWPNSRLPGQRGEHKRRKAITNSPISAYIEEAFEPVPECNSPVITGATYRRPRKRLIGSQAQLSSDS